MHSITTDISGIEGTKPFTVSPPSKAMDAMKEAFVTHPNSSGANLEPKVEEMLGCTESCIVRETEATPNIPGEKDLIQ